MRTRYLAGSDYAGLKGSTRKLVKTSDIGVTRVGQQELSKYGNPSDDHAERFMPVDIVADLEAECGMPIVTAKLAELAGCLLVPLPKGKGQGALNERSHRTAQEFAEVMSGILGALADGEITEAEGEAILQNIHEMMIEGAALAEEVRAAVARRLAR